MAARVVSFPPADRRGRVPRRVCTESARVAVFPSPRPTIALLEKIRAIQRVSPGHAAVLEELADDIYGQVVPSPASGAASPVDGLSTRLPALVDDLRELERRSPVSVAAIHRLVREDLAGSSPAVV